MNKGPKSNCLFWSKMQLRAVCATFLSRIVTHIGRSECLNMGVLPKLTKDRYPRSMRLLVSFNITERSKTVSGHDITGFIDDVLLQQLHAMANNGAGYLVFGQIGVGIEFLGACRDSKDFATTGESKARFNRGISHYMGESGRAVCRIQHEKIAIQFIQAFKMRHGPFDSAPGKDRSNWERECRRGGLATSGKASQT
jgi:hypothetical protein